MIGTELSTSLSCGRILPPVPRVPPTSHRRNRCSAWLLRKVISRRYNFPSNTPGAAKITSQYREITTPGTFGNIYNFDNTFEGPLIPV
jgi:hypothetical protein